MGRILFIESGLRNEKLGIMYLSAALKAAGHDTRLCWIEREDVNSEIQTFSPDFLAFSLTTGSHRALLELAAELKRCHGIPVIAGGPHATFFAPHIPAEAADFVVCGPGERAIVDIVEGQAADRVLSYPLADLETLPFPDRNLFYRYPDFGSNPMKNVITCRDCPYSCSYCYNHTWKVRYKGDPRFLQKRSVDSIFAEINGIRSNYPLEQVLFIDDNFLLGRRWVDEFCHRYPAEIGLPFLCSFSLNLLDESLVKKLCSAGLFMVNFALESADETVQQEILQRGHVKNEDVVQGIKLLRLHGIKTRMQNMIGLPLENSLADALKTLDFNRHNRVDDSWVSIFQPYPNTRLAEYCRDQGFIDSEDCYADSFFDRSHLHIACRDQLARLQKWWYFIIYYTIDDQWVERLLQLDLEEKSSEALQSLRFKFSRQKLYGLTGREPSLRHNWEWIVAKYDNHQNFSCLRGLIQEYKLCDELVDILMTVRLPAEGND